MSFDSEKTRLTGRISNVGKLHHFPGKLSNSIHGVRCGMESVCRENGAIEKGEKCGERQIR